MAKIELPVVEQQCLDRRLTDIDIKRSETAAWQFQRNQQHVTVIGNSQLPKPVSNSNAFTRQNHDGQVLLISGKNMLAENMVVNTFIGYSYVPGLA